MGLVDRLQRENDRLGKELETTRQRLATTQEMLEKALDRQMERDQERRWFEIKASSVEKSIEMGIQLAPTVVNAIAGRRLLGGPPPEAIVLKALLPQSEGGKLTDEQFNTVFGVYGDGPEFVCKQRGILSNPQGEIICGVAVGSAPVTELLKIMPGAQHEITQAQIAQLMSAIPMDILTPIMAAVTSRMDKQEKKD